MATVGDEVLSVFEFRVSADAVESAPAIVRETLKATRSRPGCLGVEVTVDVDDPAHYVVAERWESLAADDAYRAWRQSPEGVSPLRPILAGPPSLTRAWVREQL
ncbi:antibiotic biosynthesis monooxygenase [Herbiconiux moechotypicola]|uniref:Antibiotic biosynthesis monooxygenase n=1 Tax=Herbiconiux moechotypicola TaxID=637393 RepID=A0ABP5QJT6_9MICO|nr:antibiotic biosynthesis monooxygenase family protein [Herbiconiux moechotypicola]MCS5730191.1 antibiotic biosynthesis monooxygenase [Herbiconiux moechotypicola]